jgi:hypothetical protein
MRFGSFFKPLICVKNNKAALRSTMIFNRKGRKMNAHKTRRSTHGMKSSVCFATFACISFAPSAVKVWGTALDNAQIGQYTVSFRCHYIALYKISGMTVKKNGTAIARLRYSCTLQYEVQTESFAHRPTING